MLKYNEIQGWFCAERLYTQAAQLASPYAVMVELGTFMGKSAVFMGQTLKDLKKSNVKFFTVDHFLGSDGLQSMMESLSVYNRYLDNIKKAEVQGYVHLIKLPSLEAAKILAHTPLEFLFVDASHDYDSVIADLSAWAPRVKPGCIIGGDDYNTRFFPGVVRAVNDYFAPRKVEVFYDRVWYIEQKEPHAHG